MHHQYTIDFMFTPAASCASQGFHRNQRTQRVYAVSDHWRAVVLPDPSYRLKVVERRAGYRRTLDEYGGDWSIARYVEVVQETTASAWVGCYP